MVLSDAMVAPNDAAVPPENSPSITLTLALTLFDVRPVCFFTSFCKNKTPRSNGILSNPHEKTILAPVSFALLLCLEITSCIHPGSPHKST